MNCQFMRAGNVQCRKNAGENNFCNDHIKKKCRCGNQATAQCANKAYLFSGQKLLCWHYYCNECKEHKDCPWKV